ncbi:hypothetical protein [Psychroflexus sp. ALD_RP9]|uniref:hypothetical protein n=1 Tax=Psychroflexus sp. ALD_RP9 TaxID=2777186 RepID=UPI001A8C570B|nr:hypothetical protein [Psychroflexus sp. ALD_RP9]QSS96602.1 hypothetical protein IMZ30_09125 [Psychroflexus sp. ALD_RP9]
MQDRTVIGFKKDSSSQNNTEQHLDQMRLKMHELRGWKIAQEILLDFLNPKTYPALSGEARKKMFIEKLDKVKIRYFDPI